MSDEKTEQPTDKRLRDAREKGEVAKSQEVPSALIVLVVFGYFLVMSKSIFAELATYIDAVFKYSMSLPFDEALRRLGVLSVDVMFKILAPLVGLVIVTALVANLCQVGFLVAPKGAMPKLENLNPKKWFKQVFSKKNLYKFFKNLLKVGILTVSVYMALLNHFREIFLISKGNLGDFWTILGSVLKDLGAYSVTAFIAIASLDFIYVRFKFTKDHMMSPDEVKREYKEQEGDPLIKSKRKQLHQEMANQNTLGKTRKAKVLIVNPTHYAVALDYDKEKTPIPVILAKGQGDLARRMIEVAKQEGIPIMRQPPLARALYSEGTEDSFIPKDLLAPVAEVLRFIQSLEHK